MLKGQCDYCGASTVFGDNYEGVLKCDGCGSPVDAEISEYDEVVDSDSFPIWRISTTNVTSTGVW